MPKPSPGDVFGLGVGYVLATGIVLGLIVLVLAGLRALANGLGLS